MATTEPELKQDGQWYWQVTGLRPALPSKPIDYETVVNLARDRPHWMSLYRSSLLVIQDHVMYPGQLCIIWHEDLTRG